MPEMTEQKIDFAGTYQKYRNRTIDGIIRDVAELPDRTSPADQPEMMLVSADELRAILLNHI